MPLVSIQNLTVALPVDADRPLAVEDVSLEVGRNEIVCIVGESGSGKSLTAHAIMGLLPGRVAATAGQILFDGVDLLKLSPSAMRKRRGRDIAMIFQDPMAALNPVVAIGKQVTEQIRAHRVISEAAALKQAADLLGQMGLKNFDELLKAYPHQLSGGQRQRVMIAMALSLSPQLLIADEPTTALDVTTQAQILKLIKKIQAEREMSVLFITHDFGVVADMADKVAVMRHGRVLESGAVGEVLGNPSHSYTRALIAAVPRGESQLPPPPEARPLVEVVGLTKRFRRGGLFSRGQVNTAVDNVSLTLSRGETLGIVGESGSGKSTLARCVIRLLDPDAGTVLLDGADIAHMTPGELRPLRRRIQMVFQDPFSSLNPRQTVGDIITAGPRIYGEEPKAARARAADILRLVGLNPETMNRLPHEFSGGQRQRIGLARALMLKPDVLIADEPVSALDVTVQAQVLQLLDDVRRQMNLAMLFITHDMRVAAQVCHRVMVMRHGKVVESGPTRDIFAAPSSEYTKALLVAIPGRNEMRQNI
ncbi:MAG: ABC transporter ATP-binding protein [Alphaproteobacteria bacterium]|nr:ABC transporter ATP-binding protein [Alphaproteobacteria bacterium]